MTPCPKPPKHLKAPPRGLKRLTPINSRKPKSDNRPPVKKPVSKAKKKRGASVKTLRERADSLFSKIVRTTEPVCILCGSTQNLQASHYYGKQARPGTRYSKMNVHTMCARCHLRHHKHDPAEYGDWMRANHTPTELGTLEYLSRLTEKRGETYYLEIIKILATQLGKMIDEED